MVEHRADGNGDNEEGRPQLRMWDDADKETLVGTLEDGGETWTVFALVEPVSADLAQGRLSFRLGDLRYDTAPILLEDTPAAVVRRAVELPEVMLRQLFISARR